MGVYYELGLLFLQSPMTQVNIFLGSVVFPVPNDPSKYFITYMVHKEIFVLQKILFITPLIK